MCALFSDHLPAFVLKRGQRSLLCLQGDLLVTISH